MSTTVLDNDWHMWLSENLGRSCDPVTIYDVMRSNGFSVRAIKDLMGKAFPSGLDIGCFPSSVDYPALAGLMEREDAHPGVKRWDTDLLQMYIIENFLTAEECGGLVERAKGQLKPSEVTDATADKTFRTSMTCHLNEQTDPFINVIDDKISACLGVRWPYSEPIQMQSYTVGQELKAHHDYFHMDLESYAKVAGKSGQRTWTFTIYLNTVEKGGGTYFPYIDHVFYPMQGMAAIWNNLSPDGVPNRNTLHCALPVEMGEKFIITKWFREHGFGSMFC